MIVNPPILPNALLADTLQKDTVLVRAAAPRETNMFCMGQSVLNVSKGSAPVVEVASAAPLRQQESGGIGEQEQKSSPQTVAPPTAATNDSPPRPTLTEERRGFWERVFKLPPLRKRIEKSLAEDWKFSNIRPRQIDWLASEEGIEDRAFFMDGANARQYHRLVKEFGIGFEDRNGRVVDDSFDTISDYGPDLLKNYQILMSNKELIKRYFAGVFRNGRIGTQSLIRISNSMWFGTFEVPKFRMAAYFLHTRFQVPEHVIGPMLASVGNSFWLRPVLARKTAPAEFQQLLKKIAPSTEGSGNAFAPALQLMVLAEEFKIPFKSVDTFVDELQLRPKDFGPFSALVFNLGVYRLADEVRCSTFAMFLRRILDEFGPEINQESARLFIHSFRDFKDNGESLQAFLSNDFSETKAFLKSIGTPVPSTVWNMERLAVLTHILTPEKRLKIAQMVRDLSEEVKVADIMFLAEIADNDDECKLLMNRKALLAAVAEIKIDRIVERSHNDLVKELEREVDIANRNGLQRNVRRLMNLIKQEQRTYTERISPDLLTNIQLSRLLIFHRSLEIPGFLDTLGWNVSLDLQNERSEGGGYLGYDKDMAMVTIVSGAPGNNRQYRPNNLMRAPASLALFHNHAFKDTFAEKYLGFLSWMFPKRDTHFAGPSGWSGARKGDITAAAESELPSFIITKIGHPKDKAGKKDLKSLLVNLDWVIVDRQSGEAIRSDRGVYTVPFYGSGQLGELKWPSRKEEKRQERARREKCPPVHKGDAVMR